MDETSSSPNVSSAKSIAESTEVAASEHRQAYGTAKTENLRDSGAWRYILPIVVGLCCLALFAIPLIILVPLFVNSLDPKAYTHNLTWLWVTMMVLEIATAALIIY